MSAAILFALIGGAIIGLASAGMLLANGKILGVSGIVGGALRAKSWDLYWRIIFVVGMLIGGLFIEPFGFTVMKFPVDRSLAMVACGGLHVGFGTTIGSGCTSGHGVLWHESTFSSVYCSYTFFLLQPVSFQSHFLITS